MKGERSSDKSELESLLDIKSLLRLPVVLDGLDVKQFLITRVALAREMLVWLRAPQFSATPVTKVLRAFSASHLPLVTRKPQPIV